MNANLTGAGALTATVREPPPAARTASISAVIRLYDAEPRLMVLQPPAVIRIYQPPAVSRIDVVTVGQEQYA